MKKKIFVPISVLLGALLLALVAAMTPFVAERNLAHAQTDVSLSDLTLTRSDTNAALASVDGFDFMRTDLTYNDVRVPNAVASLMVDGMPDPTSASVRVNGQNEIGGVSIGLSPGRKTDINVVVGAIDGTSKTYKIKVYRKASNQSKDANLRSLRLTDDVSLSERFTSNKTTYTARVTAQGAAQTTVMFETNHVGALATVTAPADADPDADGIQVNLVRGMEIPITVTVNSEEATDPDAAAAVTTGSGQNQKAYTITVYRERISKLDDNNLSDIELNWDNDGTAADLFETGGDDGLADFTSATKSYTGRIATTGPSVVTVVATKVDDGAIVGDITPADVDSAISGHQVELRKGTETVISVPVTAEDGTSKTYTVKLYRKATDESDDATLSSLSLMGVSLSESFAPDKTTYTARVPAQGTVQTTVMFAANHVGALATVTAPADADPDADGIQVNLVRGMEIPITVTVNSEEATDPDAAAAVTTGSGQNQKAYTITVYRERISKLDDNNLSDIELNWDNDGTAADLFETGGDDGLADFTSATKSYTGRIATTGPSVVTVVATKVDDGAIIGDITPADVDSVISGHQVELRKGTETVISVPVTAEDGTSKTYTVKLYRKATDESDDATLSSLSLTGVSLSESFAPDKTTYTARVAENIDETTVMFAANHVGAVAMVTNADSTTTGVDDADDDADGFQVNLVRGMETSITITVNSEQATDPDAADAVFVATETATVNSKRYTITVYRSNISDSDDNNLSDIELNWDNDGTAADLFETGGDDGLADFTSATKSYTGRIATTGPSVVTVVATKVDDGAIIGDITPADADADNSGHQVELRKGTETVISVPVTAEDGTSKTYTVKLYRKATDESDDATLSSLSLMGVSLSESFAPDKTTYTATSPSSITQTTVMFETNDAGALARVTNADSTTDVDDADGDPANGFQVDLARGVETSITITVNSEQATDPDAADAVFVATETATVNSKRYTITVYRGTEASTEWHYAESGI